VLVHCRRQRVLGLGGFLRRLVGPETMEVEFRTPLSPDRCSVCVQFGSAEFAETETDSQASCRCVGHIWSADLREGGMQALDRIDGVVDYAEKYWSGQIRLNGRPAVAKL
jgi:hypothetical protein